MLPIFPKFTLIIDTNQYAGNFERQMCAFLTGHTGECGVGRDMAQIYKEDTGDAKLTKFRNVISVPDEHGCSRPVSIHTNPRWAGDGVGNIFLIDGNSNEAELCAAYVKSREGYFSPLIRQKREIINQINSGKEVKGWTVKAAEREIAKHEDDIAKAKQLTRVNRYPAYLSVAIYFDSRPTPEQIEIIKERAKLFPAAYKKEYPYIVNDEDLLIESFRLEIAVVTATEEAV